MSDPFARQAILLALLDAMHAHGSWSGETHLQKSAYVLQEGLKVPLGLDFTLYKHGPFSFDLRVVLGEMRSTFLIDVESRSPFGASLRVGEPGQRLKDRYPKTIEQHAVRIRFVAERISARDVAALERLGTALYVRSEDPSARVDRRAERITELKPHISRESALAAVNDMDALLAEAPIGA